MMFCFRHFAVKAVVLCTVLTFGCATTSRNISPLPESAANAQLSGNAQTIYYSLLFNMGIQNQDDALVSQSLAHLLEFKQSADLFITAGEYYEIQNKPASARPVLRKGLSLYPDHFYLTLLLANTYLQEKRSEDALATLEDFMRQNKVTPAQRQKLAQFLLNINAYDKAVQILQEVPLADRGAAFYFYIARGFAGLQRYAEAENALQKSLKLSLGAKGAAGSQDANRVPQTALEAWAELAYIYELQQKYTAAEHAYTRLLTLGETSPAIWLQLVSLSLKMNHPQKALEYVRQGPDDFRFLMEAGTLLLEEGFYDQADAIFTPLIKHPGHPDELWLYLAVIAVEKHNDLQRGLELLTKIPPQARSYKSALQLRIRLLSHMGATDDLEPSIHEALKIQPDNTEVLYILGSLYDRQGKAAEAFSLMEKIIRLDPKHSGALNYVGYTLAEEGRDLERALVLIQRALQLDPEKAYILDSLAWVHYKLDNISLALENIRLAVAAPGGDDPVIWEHYGDIALKAKNTSMAQKAYAKALELGAENPDIIKAKIHGTQ